MQTTDGRPEKETATNRNDSGGAITVTLCLPSIRSYEEMTIHALLDHIHVLRQMRNYVYGMDEIRLRDYVGWLQNLAYRKMSGETEHPHG